MKVLLLGFSRIVNLPFEATFSTLSNSSPFGYDLIIANPSSLSNIRGGDDNTALIRWYQSLPKWLGGEHRLIVMLMPPHGNNYIWLTLEGLDQNDFEDCGDNSYVGEIIALDSRIRNALRDNQTTSRVMCHYRPSQSNPNIIYNSRVGDGLYSSITWKQNDKEVIFLPNFDNEGLIKFVQSFGDISSKWTVSQHMEIEQDITNISEQIRELESQKTSKLEKLHMLNTKVKNIIEGDIYLQRSISSFSLTQSTENPNPENFYEAIEAIENAFSSEREMREKLAISKTFIDKVMRRTNDFRHISQTGEEPKPLTPEEIRDFTQKVKEIINKYLQFLYDEASSV
jgi:hypothetical protein